MRPTEIASPTLDPEHVRTRLAEHARKYGPICSSSPLVRLVRATTLLDAADLCEEVAWMSALRCPPEESDAIKRAGAVAAVDRLTFFAAGLRASAAITLAQESEGT